MNNFAPILSLEDSSMIHKRTYFSATIGQKQVVAATAIGLSLFVLVHMAGNLLILVSAQAYNEYGHATVTNPLIKAAEIGLAIIFLAHTFVALRLQWLNRQARPERYAVSARGDKATGLISKTMAIQGVLIFAFVIIHLKTFKYGPEYMVDYGNGPIRDLFRLILEEFQKPGLVGWYLFAVVVLGLHLSHGIKSVFQTWGANHPRYQNAVRALAIGYALIVAGGFLSQPIYVYFFYKG
jgi:succinate dehydrogenase / fumarate reductase, cytochrome b subunit